MITCNYRWNDMPCGSSTKACTACYFRKRPLLTLRGLCKATNFDQRYILTQVVNETKPIFKGYFRTSISWIEPEVTNNKTEEEDISPSWQLRTVDKNSESHAKLMSKSETAYPIGNILG